MEYLEFWIYLDTIYFGLLPLIVDTMTIIFVHLFLACYNVSMFMSGWGNLTPSLGNYAGVHYSFRIIIHMLYILSLD